MAGQSAHGSRKEIISPAPLPSLPFSQVVGVRDLVFVSGTVGRDPETREISREIAEQTRQVLETIDHQLTMAGTSLDHALKTTVFLVDMSLYEEMNESYGSFFGEHPPARSCVEVSALPDDEALIEIEVIAAR